MRKGQFDDFETTVAVGGRTIAVRIDGGVLHALWGAGVGPQTAQGIFDENRSTFDEVIAEKLLSGAVENGVVVIIDADLDL